MEPVRYPSGSDTMMFLTTPLTGGRAGRMRVVLWMKNLVVSLLRPPQGAAAAPAVGLGARESIILLCMQALEGHIDMRWGRPWFWPLGKCLVSRSEGIPTFIPQANRFAEQFAQLAGGTAMSMLPEILFTCPAPPTVSGLRHGQFGAITPLWTTATACLGTRICTCATGPWWPRNLGVNPSLTITALAERAMSFIPPEWMTWNDAAEDSRSLSSDLSETTRSSG